MVVPGMAVAHAIMPHVLVANMVKSRIFASRVPRVAVLARVSILVAAGCVVCAV
jgi:hypothetical protein